MALTRKWKFDGAGITYPLPLHRAPLVVLAIQPAGQSWRTLGNFTTYDSAARAAQALSESHPDWLPMAAKITLLRKPEEHNEHVTVGRKPAPANRF